MIEEVILVNKEDKEIGVAEKLYAHQNALLHRAFSVFVYRILNNKIEYLLQKRAISKYHSGGLWTNTCCGHPRPKENLVDALSRRLKEEVGIDADLLEIGTYYYKRAVSNDLTEHEVDHLFIGKWRGSKIAVDPAEIEDYRWASSEEISSELLSSPQSFTVWFEGIYEILAAYEKNIIK